MCVEHAGSRGLNIRWFDHRDRVAKCFHFKTRFVGSKVFYACAVCFICDAVLITIGILGVGSVLQQFPFFLNLLTTLGAVFLYWYGYNSIIRAYKGNDHLSVEQVGS
jgi:L-lysine exporter family protein LysE/ArgO